MRDDTFGYPVVIPSGSVYVTAGTDRRSSGTHYTPRSLTEPIVQYTLEPLVYVGPAEGKPKGEWKLRPAKELLDLKICDMACGSGAFLVQACRYMSDRLLEAWDLAERALPKGTPGITPEGTASTGKSGETLISNDPDERRALAQRLIAQRCLYGVDINPLAVEMAKLSLWLLTLAKDRPFTFLDHAIRCGDSLLGIHDLRQLKTFSLDGAGQQYVFGEEPLEELVDKAIDLRLKIELMPSNSVEDVEAQARLMAECEQRVEFLKCAADMLIAAELKGGSPREKLGNRDDMAIQIGHHLKDGKPGEFRTAATKELGGRRTFHWPVEFPETIAKRYGFDAFVGNPPFMRGTKIQTNISEEYLRCLLAMRDNLNGNADLCAHFFRAAFDRLNTAGTFGLLATNTIAQGDTRECGLQPIVQRGGVIFRALSSMKWPGTAAVVVSVVNVRKSGWKGSCSLDNHVVTHIDEYLSAEQTSASPSSLVRHWCSYHNGSFLNGTGFVLPKQEAETLLTHKGYDQVILPYIGGKEAYTRSVPECPDRYVIYFGQFPLEKANKWPLAIRIVQDRVYPERKNHKTTQLREKWWQFKRPTPELYAECQGALRVIAKTQVSRTFAFLFLPSSYIFDQRLIVFPDSRGSTFAVLQSGLHECWAERYAATLKSDMSYTPKDCFETFAFPLNANALEQVGNEYDDQRKLMMRERSEGLTLTYNRFHNPDKTAKDIQKLRDLHVEMDKAVAAAYGWDDLDLGHGFHQTKQGLRFTISDPARREVLARLLKLNHERYAEEVAQGLHDKKKGKGRKKADTKQGGGLFEEAD